MFNSQVNLFLENLKREYRAILQDNLVGIYLHGSLVFDCFNPQKSDIDFIVVVNEKLSTETKRLLADFLLSSYELAPAKGFEMSVVLKRACRIFVYPTPYELHFSDYWRSAYLENPAAFYTNDLKTDWDLAAHFRVIQQKGQVHCGAAIADVFGPVNEEYYRDSIYRDIAEAEQDILTQPTYLTLNLCRVLAYFKEGRLLSKKDGGLWALKTVDAEYEGVIKAALQDYRENKENTSQAADRTAFAAYMLKEIKEYNHD